MTVITSGKSVCSVIFYTIDCGRQRGGSAPWGAHTGMFGYIFGSVCAHWWQPWRGDCVALWCKETSEAAKRSLRHRTALIERVIPPEIPVEPRLENPTF